jgi:hypothetical protein
VTSRNAIPGHRIGAGRMGEPDRGVAAPRIRVSFWCVNKHETRPGFAVDAVIPDTWECPRCGNPAGPDKQDPPARRQAEPHKTHLAYVKERRSESDGEAILAEALARLRGTTPAQPPAPGPAPAASAACGDGQSRRGQRARRPEEPASAPRPPAATEHGHDTQQPPEPGRGRGPARRNPAQAGRARGGSARRAGEGPRVAGHAAGPARPGGGPDLVAGDAVAAPQSPRARTGSSPGGAGPASPEPPAGKPCKKCGYLTSADGHKRTCLGQW